MIINFTPLLTLVGPLYDTTVTIPPGFEVCDQRITAERLTVFGLSIVGIVLCLILIWINSAAEAGLTNLSRFRLQALKERHEKNTTLLEELLDRPAQISAAINLLNTACLMFVTGLAVLALHQLNLYGPEVTVVILVLTFLTLSLSRVVPKGYALHNPEGAVLRFSGFINVETRIARPIVGAINGAANFVLGRFKIPPVPANTFASEEELAFLANIGEEEGLIEADERQMIRSIFQFGDTIVREVMRPRLDIKAVPVTASLNEILDVIIASGNSRLPVYQPDIDHILGILYAKDLLRYLRQPDNQPFDPRTLLRPVYYVPESKKVDQLFAELQKQRVHIAIIVDEYGGTAGVVTIEDLLEEIVGEIQDEYDTAETADFERVGPDEVLLDARLNLADVNEFFDTQWESEDIETVGGFVYDKLGRIPVEGDDLLLDREGHLLTQTEDGQVEINRAALESPLPEIPIISDYFRLSVLKVTGQRLQQVSLHRLTAAPPIETATEATETSTKDRPNRRLSNQPAEPLEPPTIGNQPPLME